MADEPSWKTSPYHRAGSALAFPLDAGWHQFLRASNSTERRRTWPGPSRMEWVYANVHLKEVGGEGRSFVCFVAYFSQNFRFLVVRAWDREDRYLGAWTGSAFGTMRATPGRFDTAFKHSGGEDRWHSIGQDFSSRLHAIDDAGHFTVGLDLVNTKTPYEAGGIGYLPFADSGWFSYYSLTRLDATGLLQLDDKTIPVEGFGWFDHQWGDFFVTPFRNRRFEEYEWMSVQLDSGDELMLTTVWNPDESSPSVEAFGGAGLITREGKFERIIGNAGFTRTRFWRSIAQNTVYSAGWRFVSERWGADLHILPRHPDQLTPIADDSGSFLVRAASRLGGGVVNRLGSFWEGSCRVTGTFRGKPATGVAFAELIKRYDDPELTLDVCRNELELTVFSWKVRRRDPQVPLTYSFLLEYPTGGVLSQQHGLDVGVMVVDDPKLPRHVPLRARVIAKSCDGTLRGEATRDVMLGRAMAAQ